MWPGPKHARGAIERLEGLLRLRLVKPAGITCRGKSDGAGAQIQAMLSTIAFCRAHAIPYYHTPLASAEHIRLPEELAAWERFFNLQTLAARCVETSDVLTPAAELTGDLRFWRRKQILAIEHMHAFTDRNPDVYLSLQGEILAAAALPAPPESANLRIAIHVRRGDVSPVHNTDRFTPSAAIAATIRQLETACSAAGLSSDVTIYSQGSADDFADLVATEPWQLVLNGVPLRAIADMACADILIMGKSSFSYVAGLINRGVVIYEPFWHQPLSQWISLGPDGVLAEPAQRQLAGRLLEHLQARARPV